jgi:hypothetical protein
MPAASAICCGRCGRWAEFGARVRVVSVVDARSACWYYAVAVHAVRPQGPLTVVSRLFAALLFLSFVISQAPHTVHHLFEPDHTDTECPFASAGDRLPGLGAEVTGFDHGQTWASDQHPPASPRLPSTVVSSSLARAPPHLSSRLV